MSNQGWVCTQSLCGISMSRRWTMCGESREKEQFPDGLEHGVTTTQASGFQDNSDRSACFALPAWLWYGATAVYGYSLRNVLHGTVQSDARASNQHEEVRPVVIPSSCRQATH